MADRPPCYVRSMRTTIIDDRQWVELGDRLRKLSPAKFERVYDKMRALVEEGERRPSAIPIEGVRATS